SGALLSSFREAYRQGIRGAALDFKLFCAPWGFEPQEIKTPVFLWHGEMDELVPASMSRYLAETLPNCRASFLPEEGHYSLPVTQMRLVLKTLLGCEQNESA